jgi:hypothetical protein
MLETIYTCPVCNCEHFTHYMTCKDHLVSHENFKISKCSNCHFLFTNPRPHPTNLGSYYKSDEYISHTDKSNNLTNTLYKLARTFTLNQKLNMINSLVAERTILDFGCGTGDFLSTCKRGSWTVHGFEPNSTARSIAEQKTREVNTPRSGRDTTRKRYLDYHTLACTRTHFRSKRNPRCPCQHNLHKRPNTNCCSKPRISRCENLSAILGSIRCSKTFVSLFAKYNRKIAQKSRIKNKSHPADEIGQLLR